MQGRRKISGSGLKKSEDLKREQMANAEKPFIIPVFLPHIGCLHRCVFCNQMTITGVKEKIPSPEQLRRRIKTYLTYRGSRRTKTQVSFYGGNFLGLKSPDIRFLLDVASEFIVEGSVDSLRFSTRPDSVNDQRLDIIKEFPVETIEIGAQSMDDRVLVLANRGHTVSDTEKAVGLLKKRSYEIGLQMMVGLPGDDDDNCLRTGRRITDLLPDFVRIYPTVVLPGSRLWRLYRNGTYSPLPMERCVTLVKNLYLLFSERQIPVIRMGLQASDDLEKEAENLAGPYHPAFGHLVFSEIFLDKAAFLLASKPPPFQTVTIRVHPRNVSRMRGMNNQNIETLKRKFQIKSLVIFADASLGEDAVTVSEFRPSA
jgi:histone acetyltransferase (RNA polymerase elongator complex component)